MCEYVHFDVFWAVKYAFIRSGMLPL